MKVIKNIVRDYDCYWNAETNKWTGLINATVFDDNENVAEVEEGKLLDWNDVTGLSNNHTNLEL